MCANHNLLANYGIMVTLIRIESVIVVMERERIHYLDLAKGIGMILVVLGHIGGIGLPLRYFIVSFHMPMFFIISGILFQVTKEETKDIKNIVYKKWKHIMIPYFAFSFFYFVIEILYHLVKGGSDWPTIWHNLYLSVCLHGVSVLWFLPAIFFGEILFLFVRKHVSHIWTIMITVVLTIFMCFANLGEKALFASYGGTGVYSYLHSFVVMFIRCFIAMTFICIGYYIYFVMERLAKKSILCFITGILFMGLTIVISQINGGVDMNYLVFSNVGLFFIAATLGSVGVILLCKSVEKFHHFVPNKVMEYYGKNSLIIMATHINFYILYAATMVSIRFNDRFVTRAKSYVFCFMVVVLVFAMEVVVIEVINRCFPFILGKSYPPQKVKENIQK